MGLQEEMSGQNREAWDYHAYEYWCRNHGPPSEVAKRMRENPASWIRGHTEYLGNVTGKKIVNLLGACGQWVRS